MHPMIVRAVRVFRPFVLAGVAVVTMARAAPAGQIAIPGEDVEPESITSSKDGTLYISSMGPRIIYRVKPGATSAEAWIQPPQGILDIYGITADDASSTLWACSGDYFGSQEKNPPTSAVFAFDLKTGKEKARYPLTTPGTVCNDIAIGPDGTAYVTEMNKMEVHRIRKGAKALELWAGNGGFGPTGGLLDGITLVGNRLIVGAIRTSKLFSVPIQADGRPGPITELKLDGALQGPDGMRGFGKDMLVMAGGKLSHIVLSGNTGQVHVLKEGFTGGAPCVTVVGSTGYVVSGMQKGQKAQVTPVDVGKP